MSDEKPGIINLRKKQYPPIIKTAAQNRAELPRGIVDAEPVVHKGPSQGYNPLGATNSIQMQNNHRVDKENYGASVSENVIVHGEHGNNVNRGNLAKKFKDATKQVGTLDEQKMAELMARLQAHQNL